MTREEFEKLKAAERAHQEELRNLKQTARQLDRRRSVVGALDRLRDAARDLLDRHEDAVDELARETAFLEARAEMGLEDADEELRALRAEKLVEQIRQSASSEAGSDPATPPGPTANDTETPAVEKTIGRMKR